MRKSARWPFCVAAPLIALPLGCQLLVGLDQPLGAGATDGSSTDAPTGDGSADAASDRTVRDARSDAHRSDARGKEDGPQEGSVDGRADAGRDSAPEAAKDSAPYCPDAGGAPSINVGPFCVDGTEATNADYSAFLASFPPGTLQPPECQSWNTTYVPVGWPPPGGTMAHPVTNVNWCDAWAYCAWAGKRLCGNIGGGPASYTTYASPTNEHFFACSLDGGQKYPYGATYKPTACNVPDRDAGRLFDPGSLKGCEGAFPGLYDMVGNVMEWQNACDGDASKSDHCLNGAVAYDKGPTGPTASCASRGEDPRNAELAYVGIRCCADLE